MKAVNWLKCLVVTLLLMSCSREELGPGGSSIVGTWRLYEQGYSPGNGYFVNNIPAQPLQSLTFIKTGEVIQQGERLNDIFGFPFYRVTTVQDKYKIKFLNSKKEESATGEMSLRIEGDTMRITPSCFEGCHYSFVRIP